MLTYPSLDKKGIFKIMEFFIYKTCFAFRLREIDELTIFGTPATSVVAIRSEQFHIYKLGEILLAKHWNINSLQFPPG
jgi:hypothetical protein